MPEAFDLHWDRGWEFYEADKFEEAIAEWRLAGELDPADGYVNKNIGLALSELGQKDAAFSEWQKAVHLEPKYYAPYIHLADALLKSGDVSEALATIDTAIRLCPPSADLYIRLGCYLTMQANENRDRAGWEAAATAFQQAIDIDSANPYALSMLGELKWYLGEKREAIEALQAAVAVIPDSFDAHIQLATYQYHTGSLKGAVRTFRILLSLFETQEGERFLAKNEMLMKRLKTGIYVGVGLTAVFTGVWVWYRRRRG